MALKSFSTGEVILSSNDTLKIFAFFFGNSQDLESKDITDEDKAFAQALMVEAISSSQAFGFTELLFKVFGTGLPSKFGTVKGIVEFMVKKGSSLWFHNTIKTPVIYETIRRTLCYAYVHSEWGTRIATGEYINKYLK